jgi:hypothetical protein
MFEAQPRLSFNNSPVRQSLTALDSGKAAKLDQPDRLLTLTS